MKHNITMLYEQIHLNYCTTNRSSGTSESIHTSALQIYSEIEKNSTYTQ